MGEAAREHARGLGVLEVPAADDASAISRNWVRRPPASCEMSPASSPTVICDSQFVRPFHRMKCWKLTYHDHSKRRYSRLVLNYDLSSSHPLKGWQVMYHEVRPHWRRHYSRQALYIRTRRESFLRARRPQLIP